MPSSGKIRAVIADDEPLARKRIRRLLQLDPEVEVVGECGNAAETVTAIEEHSPDLLFLDVQMPGGTGFDALRAVATERTPVVVFVTAYDQYAVKAFEVHAQDYLLKPFDRQRFQKSLRQAKEQVSRRQSAEANRRLIALLENLQPGPGPVQRLIVKTGGRILVLKTADIDWVEAADNYVRLHAGGESHLLRETMSALDKQLDPARFARIHRSTIVNLDRIEQLQPWFRGDYLVMLRGGTKLTLSKAYRDRVLLPLGNAFHPAKCKSCPKRLEHFRDLFVCSDMVNLSWIAPVLLAAGPAFRADMDAAKASLIEVDEQFAAATAAKGLDGFLSFFADNATILPRKGPLIVGREAIRKYYAAMFAEPGFSFTWSPLRADVAVSGEIGYTLGTVARSGTQSGKYNLIWKKQTSGTWKIVAEMGLSEAEPDSDLEPAKPSREIVYIRHNRPVGIARSRVTI